MPTYPILTHVILSAATVASLSSIAVLRDDLRAPGSDPSAQVWYLGADDLPRPTGSARATSPSMEWPPTWPDEFTTGASCEVACIRWGRAHDNGSHTSVYLNVKTTTPVLWELHVTNDELGYADTRAELTSWTTQAHATYTDLEAATTYDATVTVRDQWGNVEHASGSFTTSP